MRHMPQRAAQQLGGASLLAAGVIILMGIITAEALRPPGYSTSHNDISDLGVAVQPSATLFDAVMIVSGILILLGAYGVYRAYHSHAVGIPLALLGLGVLGVGVFPGDPGNIVHPWVSLLAFIAGGVAAILAYRVAAAPFRYISVVLGTIALLSLVLAETDTLTAVLGTGGAERWVAYPTVLWLVGFGGYVMGRQSDLRQTVARPTAGVAEPMEQYKERVEGAVRETRLPVGSEESRNS